jgi:multiple sugar transport system permease protein
MNAKRRRKIAQELCALGFTAPFLILFITFVVIPVAVAIGLSFTDFNTVL